MKNTLKVYCLKIIFVFLFLSFLNFPVSAQNIQEKIINGKFVKTSLQEFFNTLEKEYGIHFYYRAEWIKPYVINQEFKEMPLIQVLNLLFERQPLTFRFFQNNSVVVFPKGIDGRTKTGTDEPQVLVIGDPLNEGRYSTAHLKGKILDGKNNQPLMGAIIFHPQTGIGTSTNTSGNYELDLPTGDHTLQVTFMGYEVLNQKIKLIESGTANFELFEKSHNLEEVTVKGEDSKATKAQMSMIRVNSRMLKELPVMMGETDIIKTIVMMPGIQSVGEMSSGFNVRGGNTD
ncbi:MAG TPA: carboxypeptidase-like regulatory domain-containing protein, partial [Prolixibacteraceae bacterium]